MKVRTNKKPTDRLNHLCLSYGGNFVSICVPMDSDLRKNRVLVYIKHRGKDHKKGWIPVKELMRLIESAIPAE